MITRCRNKIFHVYSVEDAKKHNIVYSDKWRVAKKDEWVLTSDNKVLQVLNVRQENKKDRKKPVVYIRTGFGETPTYKSNLYARKYPDPINDAGFMYEVTRDVKPTVLQKRFIDALRFNGEIDQNGMWTNESVINAYQSVYSDNNPTNSLKRANIILKKKRVQEHMSELMKDKLMSKGLNDDYVAENLKKFVEDKKISPNVRLNALNRVSTLLGHDEKKVEQLEGVTTIAISEGDKKMLAEFRKQLSDKELENIIKFGDINGNNKNNNADNKRRINNPRPSDKSSNSRKKQVYSRKGSDEFTTSTNK